MQQQVQSPLSLHLQKVVAKLRTNERWTNCLVSCGEGIQVFLLTSLYFSDLLLWHLIHKSDLQPHTSGLFREIFLGQLQSTNTFITCRGSTRKKSIRKWLMVWPGSWPADQLVYWSFTGSECLSNMPFFNFSTESEDRALSGQRPRWLQ